MKKVTMTPFAKAAILTLAEIKAAVEAFERGETNVLHALDTIAVAVEAHRAAPSQKPGRTLSQRKAA